MLDCKTYSVVRPERTDDQRCGMDADFEVAVVAGQPYSWPVADERSTPWLNRAGSRVLDQDHPVVSDGSEPCRVCGHSVGYRADSHGITHVTLSDPWVVLAELAVAA